MFFFSVNNWTNLILVKSPDHGFSVLAEGVGTV